MACFLMLGLADAATAGPCRDFVNGPTNWNTALSGIRAGVTFQANGDLAPFFVGSDCGFPSIAGSDPASLTVDYRGKAAMYGDATSSLGAATSSPYGNDAIWGYGDTSADYGVLRAHAVTNFRATGGPQGEASSATAQNRDEFVITHPTKTGSDTLTVTLFVTGDVRLSRTGEDDQKTDPAGGYSASISRLNSQGRTLDAIVLDSDSRSGVAQTQAGFAVTPSGELSFVYDDPFWLISSLTASAIADTTFRPEPDRPFEQPARVTQFIESHFGATGYLGFLLPEGAMLTAPTSGAIYYQASDDAALAALIPSRMDPSGPGGPVTVPLPATGSMLLSGLGLLVAGYRRQRAIGGD